MDMRNLSLAEMEDLQRRNAMAMRPCTPEQQQRHNAQLTNGARADSNPLAQYRTDLLTLRDTHALRLASLRSGTSAHKTVSGILRGIQMAIDALERK